MVAISGWHVVLPVALALGPLGMAFGQPDLAEFSDLGELFGMPDRLRGRVEEVEISVADEKRIGEQQWGAFVLEMKRQRVLLRRRGRDHRYGAALVAKVHPLMQHAKRYRSIDVWVADSPATDARAFPGGRIVISRGLIEFAESEAAFVGVVAHELSHIDRFHQLEQLRSYLAARDSIRRAPFSPQQAMSGAQLMLNAFARPFRPEQETAADGDAVRWMMQLGYQPLEFARLFARLAERDGDSVAERLPAFLRSHPARAQRRADVVRTMTQVAQQRGIEVDKLVVGREAWRRRTIKKSPAR